MSSCSSCTPASQQAIVQLLQNVTKPDLNAVPDVTKVKSEPPAAADALKTEGPRGTQLNISA